MNELFKVINKIVTIPTDFLGITNYSGKEKALQLIKIKYLEGVITWDEYNKLKQVITN